MTIDTSKLKRYKPGYVHSNDGPGYISMLAREDGEYVRLEDVIAITIAIEQALTQQRGGVEDEDYHVIMSMGRLLAEIAVILKGAEPAGTAWSYHDLPDLVKSAVENAHDIASEMRAWAAVKMRDRGSSRRDKMMVEEWSKRLLALPEVAFPVKDFDIPGLSITKEEIRFAIRKVVADRAFIGQDFGDTTPQPSADAVREVPDGMVLVPREPTEAMVIAGESAWPKIKNACCPWPDPEEVYAAMLSAASGEKGGDDRCHHENGSPGYDHWRCRDCGAFKTDSGWGVASHRYFNSRADAEFYQNRGHLPENAGPQPWGNDHQQSAAQGGGEK